MKVAVVGSRRFGNPKYRGFSGYEDDFLAVATEVQNATNIREITAIVSGGALGVDKLAERLAGELGVEMIVFPAEWKKYGKKAGPIRNAQVVEACDMMVAFPCNKSIGTYDAIKKAKAAGKNVIESQKAKDKNLYRED